VNVFRRFGGWVGRRNMHAMGPIVNLGGRFWQQGFNKYPLLGMVASTVFLRFSRPIAKVALRAGLGVVVLAIGIFWVQKATNPSDS
jgi:hypothetical protein